MCLSLSMQAMLLKLMEYTPPWSLLCVKVSVCTGKREIGGTGTPCPGYSQLWSL